MKQLPVISRRAPFDLVKVQKGLVHGRNVKRGQTISSMLHFCSLCPLFPPPLLGNWRNHRVSSLCSSFLAFCVLLPGTLRIFEVALTVDHEAPQNTSWHNLGCWLHLWGNFMGCFVSKSVNLSYSPISLYGEMFKSLWPKWLCAGFHGCRHVHWRHWIVERWWLVKSSELGLAFWSWLFVLSQWRKCLKL